LNKLFGIFGFPKEVHQYSLHQIKVFDGRVQAIQGEHSGNKSLMFEIYFTDGQSEFLAFK
jgi:hypothetical protein